MSLLKKIVVFQVAAAVAYLITIISDRSLGESLTGVFILELVLVLMYIAHRLTKLINYLKEFEPEVYDKLQSPYKIVPRGYFIVMLFKLGRINKGLFTDKHIEKEIHELILLAKVLIAEWIVLMICNLAITALSPAQ